jgi:hypothetical protein
MPFYRQHSSLEVGNCEYVIIAYGKTNNILLIHTYINYQNLSY